MSKTKITGSQRAQFKKRIKKIKWSPNNPKFETLVTVFSERLAKEIRSIVLSQCVGCMLGQEDDHDVCIDKNKCIEDFLEASMHNLDNDYMCNILCNDYDISNYSSIEDLLLNKIFINSVKAKLIVML